MSTKSLKTVNLGNKKVELHFKGKISSLPKNKWTKVTAAWSSADGSDSGFLDAKYLVDNEGVITIKTSEGEYRFLVNPAGNLVPAGGTDLFGGALSKENGEKVATARSIDDRVYALTKIITRFCAIEERKYMFDFFGHLLKELHSWLDAEGHKNEAACLLSFATKNPFFGAVLFLQFVSPIGIDILSEQRHLFDALIGKLRNFYQNINERTRDFFTAGIRNHTVRAVL
jgi:hypothetical protein